MTTGHNDSPAVNSIIRHLVRVPCYWASYHFADFASPLFRKGKLGDLWPIAPVDFRAITHRPLELTVYLLTLLTISGVSLS